MANEPLLIDSQESAIEALEKLLAEVRVGNVVEFYAVAVLIDETYRLIGSQSVSRHQAAGMLLHMAMERISGE
jgi:hypothetical protein